MSRAAVRHAASSPAAARTIPTVLVARRSCTRTGTAYEVPAYDVRQGQAHTHRVQGRRGVGGALREQAVHLDQGEGPQGRHHHDSDLDDSIHNYLQGEAAMNCQHVYARKLN